MTDRIVSEIWPEINEAKRLLATIKSPMTAASTSKKVIELLDAIQHRLANVPVSNSKGRRDAQRVKYEVQSTELGEALAEIRPGHVFKCPKLLYETLVEVLGEASTPLTSAEIAEAAKRKSGMELATYHYGLVLRFFLRQEEPPLMRARGRYAVVNQKTFPTVAKDAWTAAKKARASGMRASGS